MKTKKEYEHELNIIDGIKKCILRYAVSISDDKDEVQSDWCLEYKAYLNKREQKIRKKIERI